MDERNQHSLKLSGDKFISKNRLVIELISTIGSPSKPRIHIKNHTMNIST